MTLTDKDLQNIKNLLEVTVEEKLEEATDTSLASKDDISHLPTKEEFFGKMDEVMGELKAIREEQDILAGLSEKVNDNEERLTRVEKRVLIQSPD